MNRFLHRQILLPLFESGYHRRRTFHYMRELERTQWLDQRAMEELQFNDLKNLITHAFANCPYYRRLWNELDLKPDHLKSPADLQRWPTTCREDILEHRTGMRAPRYKLIAKSTGGSSGTPLRFDLNTDSHDRRNAAAHRGYSWAGANLGDKMLYIWGGPAQPQTLKGRMKDSLYAWLYRRKVVNSFCVTEERIPEILAAHNRYRPDAIVAYTNPLYELARALKDRKWTPRPPKTIVVGAEKLHAFQRELIQEVFQAPVFETYGSREVMLMSAECEQHQGLHVTCENVLLEILNDEGNPAAPGEEGNIAVTDLFNYGMPFIRYLNGDRGVAGFKACSCGRGLPLMAPPIGRQLDILRFANGRNVAGEFFPHMIKDFPAVRRFQVVQKTESSLQVRLVVTSQWRTDDRETLRKTITRVVGNEVDVELLEVDQISLTATGKLRVVVNECPAGSRRGVELQTA